MGDPAGTDAMNALLGLKERPDGKVFCYISMGWAVGAMDAAIEAGLSDTGGYRDYHRGAGM